MVRKKLTEEELRNLPNNIRRLRQERGLTLQDVIKRMPGSMSPQNLGRLELGEHRLTDGQAQRIGVGLGCHPFELYKDAPGTMPYEDLVSLSPKERRLLNDLRNLPERERERAYAVFEALISHRT